MIQWKGIETLQNFKKMWIRLRMWLGVFVKSEHLSLDRSPLEAGLNVEKKSSTTGSSIQGKVGFRYIMEKHCKLPSRFPSFFFSHACGRQGMSGSVEPVFFPIPLQPSSYYHLTVLPY